jgi:hypothetical protein
MSDEEDINVTHIPVSAWTLLPPAADACQECGAHHEPDDPHNPQSLYWQTKRNIAGEPMPTWEEALEHCPPEVYAAWYSALRERGVDVKPKT